MNPRRFPRLLLVSFLAVGLASCFSSVDSSLKLEPSPLLSGGPGWVVIKEAYTRLKEKPSKESADLAHIRRGGAFKIQAVELGDASDSDNAGPWYRIEAEGVTGWVQAADIDVESSREQAQYAASAYH